MKLLTRYRSARWSRLLPGIRTRAQALQTRTDEELLRDSLSLRYRARSGDALAAILPEAFGLVVESAGRSIGMRHFDVQLIGGIALFHECITEMATGEGKTLVATLPAYLYGLSGRGVHVATANDYLAERDARWMAPVYERLGLSVGVIQANLSREQRRVAYAADITYGTAKEFGFDFLRDELARRDLKNRSTLYSGGRTGSPRASPVMRDSYFALVDEADSILIDEARTPLIIGAADNNRRQQLRTCFCWAAVAIENLHEGTHFKWDDQKKEVSLQACGRNIMRQLSAPPAVQALPVPEMLGFVERALKVQQCFVRDREYIVRDGEVVIVDEFTGRLSEGRQWRDGIHQAVEAKEGVEITVETGHAARVTVQELFSRYQHLAGMTGTAMNAVREFRRVYRRNVIAIPTNRPPQRRQLEDRVFHTTAEKLRAVVDETRGMHESERPVLIGTRSISKSQEVSELLTRAGIEHQVLNARHPAEEAEIVAAAGQRGRVTVATNMAGRGTDIQLDEGVAELGGLHVICTELHDSSRIDRQLVGRCGRQGDPGTWRQYLALDDEILRSGFGVEKAQRLAAIPAGSEANPASYSRLFRRAQRNVERRHLQDRLILRYAAQERGRMIEEMGHNRYLHIVE